MIQKQIIFTTFVLLLIGCLAPISAIAQYMQPTAWQRADWWRNSATLDLDFYNDRYYLNGTTYSSVGGFIVGAGATFTRAGTNNVTSTNPPFYLDSSQGQAFVSRASSATYFDSSGTMQTASINTARQDYDPVTHALNGTLIEPTTTNYIRNNSMSGAVSATTIAAQTVTDMTASSTTVTVTTASAHNLATNNIVTVSGASDTNYNGTFAVASVPSSTTFTYTAYTAPSASPPGTLGSYIAQTRGTMPTNWGGAGVTSGIARTVAATGTEYGMNYIDMRFFGTASAIPSTVPGIPFDSSISASAGQDWTTSFYVRLIAGDPNVGTGFYVATNWQNSGSYINEVRVHCTPTSTLQKCVATGTAPASTTTASPYIKIGTVTTGEVVDATVRVYMPQAEQKTFATSVIYTSSGTVARSADVYSVPSGGTYFSSAGTLKNAPTNTARLDYDPVGHYPKGVLIEESRANLLTYSDQTDNAAWGKTFLSAVNANVASITAPDGTHNAEKIIEDSSNNYHGLSRTYTVADSTILTFSAYVKAGERATGYIQSKLNDGSSYATVKYDLATGAITTVSGPVLASSMNAVGNGWYRVSLTYDTGTGGNTGYVFVVMNYATYTGDGTSGYYVWGAQLEAGAFATSYIPTSGSTVTRTADVFTIPTTAGGGWYTAGQGTLAATGSIANVNSAAFPGFTSIDDGTGNNSIHIYLTGTSTKNSAIYSGGVLQGGYASVAYTPGNILKGIIAFQNNDLNGSFDGTIGSDDTSVTVPTVSVLRVGAGRGGSAALTSNGWTQRIWYMPTRQPNAALQDYTR
jgi:hypothetical protein